MKVACVSASRIPSLTANSLQAMKACQAISQLGHDVCLFVPKNGHPSNEAELASFYGLEAAFQINWMSCRRSLHRYDLAYQAARQARQMKADVAYVWLVQAGIFALLNGLPVILEMHGPPEGKYGPLLFNLFQRLPGKKRLLPITHALAGQIQKRFRTKPHLMWVSPNGVELKRYEHLPEQPAARASLGLPDKLTVGYTGHLYPGRGMALILELAKCFPSLSFLWVGGNPEDVSAWRERLYREKINNVILTGFIQNSQLPLYQAAADILLMPYEKVITGSSGGNSFSYASPMKMFEYMACRRAIISSDLPVIREVLNPSNAMLCPPDDISTWTEALGCLVSDEKTRLDLAQRAWQDVQKYTWLERARSALAGFGR